eukprot:CAMPEP_0116895712 /NCGR_PEP_ID=MMETSP0467-20121206/5159_1 /TAXON_ID=283647 /ORGANISM="Mesodinium pulex, Strain SPMC105" /LENGTH=68 /DNA_ID=CAMNT_0004566563 /DNA_START=244 /DNA_END=450 /DNA_ORIENTATION=+
MTEIFFKSSIVNYMPSSNKTLRHISMVVDIHIPDKPYLDVNQKSKGSPMAYDAIKLHTTTRSCHPLAT